MVGREAFGGAWIQVGRSVFGSFRKDFSNSQPKFIADFDRFAPGELLAAGF